MPLSSVRDVGGVFQGCFGVLSAQENAIETPHKQVLQKKRVKIEKKVENLDKSKIQKTTLPDQTSARRLRHDIGAM